MATDIRNERPTDEAGAAALLRAALGGPDEAALGDRWRRAAAVTLSLVAVRHQTVVGHVLFSPLPIDLDVGRTVAGAALAPVAVSPSWQWRGISSAGRARLAGRAIAGVVVLGDPAWYRRFGFAAPLAAGLHCPVAGSALQALDLVAGAHGPDPVAGAARYHAAFLSRGDEA